jgi:signal transduction histidine kinase
MSEASPAELKYQIARQRDEIKTINEVGRLLRSTLNTQKMIGQVASYLRRAFPLALCGVLLPEQRKLLLIRFAPISPVDMTNILRQILAETASKLKLTLTEEQVTPVLEDQFGGGGAGPVSEIRSSLALPLTLESGKAGLLFLFTGKANAFGEQELHSIQIVADQLQAALRNALLVEKLQQADATKNELLAVISHELRIPLTVIGEGVNLLSEGALGTINAEQADFLKTIDQNVDRFGALLDKVLLATHLITGKFVLNAEPADLNKLLNTVEERFKPAAGEKKVALERTGEKKEIALKADAKRLEEALGQLVLNGIQATPEGGKVSVSLAAKEGSAEIVIADTGKGIAAEALPKLFDSFRSIGGINDRKTGGLGLGLFIAQGIIEAHGGTIQVDSAPGKGTKFTIKLPAAKA